MAEKLLSATATMRRPGSQRATRTSAWRAQSVSFLCRRPRAAAWRSEGASTVRKGSPQTHPAQGTGASSMTHSQRRPLALCEIAAAGPHGIAVDAARLDPGPPAPLDGVVEADHHRALRGAVADVVGKGGGVVSGLFNEP
jgi:hypothetical protein